MVKIKLTREAVQKLWIAIDKVQALSIPAKARYAIAKSKPTLLAEIKSTEEAFPKPVNEDFDKEMKQARFYGKPEGIKAVEEKFPDAVKAWSDWEKSIEPHMKEEVELDIFKTDLFEVDDANEPDPTRRNVQNQALIEWLMPMFN